MTTAVSYLIAHIKPPPVFGRKLVMPCVQRDLALARRVALFWTNLHACLLLIHNLNYYHLLLLLLPPLPHLPTFTAQPLPTCIPNVASPDPNPATAHLRHKLQPSGAYLLRHLDTCSHTSTHCISRCLRLAVRSFVAARRASLLIRHQAPRHRTSPKATALSPHKTWLARARRDTDSESA